MKDPAKTLAVVRRQAEDCAAVTHQLVTEDAEGMQRVVALSKAPARELTRAIKDMADYLQGQRVLHLSAYRLARANAGLVNAIIDREAA